MQKENQEKIILNIITYGPIVFILAVSIIITQILLLDKQKTFKNEIKNYEKTFMNENKQRIKEEVNEVYNYVLSEKLKAENLLKQSIKIKVDDAHKIANSIYTLESTHSNLFQTDKEILQSIKNTLDVMTYNNKRGYFFIFNDKGVSILQPTNKKLEGKNILELEDDKGYKFVKKIVTTIKNKTENYDSYYWHKPGDKSRLFKKISFYKYFEPLNIAIGTGEYIEDFNQELKIKVLERIRNIRYGKNGYIFISDLNGNVLSHSNKTHIGTNRFNYQNNSGKYILQEIIKQGIEKKSGFLSYDSSYKPKNKHIVNSSKISYIKLFEEWGWIIGTGFYTDLLSQSIEKKKNELLVSNSESIETITYYSIFITLVFIFISFLLSRKMKQIFESYNNTISKKESENIQKNIIIYQQSKMTVIGELLNIIAHQWRQPLSQINSITLQMYLEQKNGTLDKERLKNNINEIENTTQYLSQTIDDFSKFFIQESKEIRFPLNESINQCIGIINPSLHHIDLQIDFKSNNYLQGYRTLFQQVIISLMSNSIEIFDDKDIKEPYINITTYEQDQFIFIEISDNGGGIQDNHLSKIFDLYFSTKQNKTPSGHGLYIVKEIIEKQFHGNIFVKNINNGVKFTIRIKNHDK